MPELPGRLRCGALLALPSHGRPGSDRVWGGGKEALLLTGVPAGKIVPETKT